MPIISAKRQITLPIEQCRQLGLQPGDSYISYIAEGRITIIKKIAAAAKGILKHIKADDTVTDNESLRSRIDA